MFFGELVCGLTWSEWDMWDMWPSLFLMGLLTAFRSVRHGTDFLEFPAMRVTEMRFLNSKTPAVSSTISLSGNNLISLLHVESTFWEFDLRNDLTSRHSDLRGSTPLLPWRPHRAWRCMTSKRSTQKMLNYLEFFDEFYPYFSASFPSSLSSFSRWQDDTNPLLRKRCLAAAAMNCVRSPRNWSCHARARESRRKLVEPHLNFSWKWLEKNTEIFRLNCKHLRFFVTLFNENNHPNYCQGTEWKKRSRTGMGPKAPWMVALNMIEAGRLWLVTRFHPQKNHETKTLILCLVFKHRKRFFLSFFVSVFLCSACFFNLSKRLSTPQHLTPRESREKTEERIGTPSLKVHLPESRGFFLLEFSSMDFFWWNKMVDLKNLETSSWRGFFSRKHNGLCTKPSWSYSVNVQASLLQLQRSVPLSQTRKLIVL